MHPNPIKTDAKSFITFKGVTLKINDELWFENTDWVINLGQHWAIIGPNSSGKSILTGAILGEVNVIRGRIGYFFDENSDDSGRAYCKRGEIIKVSPEEYRRMLLRHGQYYQARWQSFEGDTVATVADFLTGQRIERISPYEVTPLRFTEAEYQTRRDQAVTMLGIEYLLERKTLHLSNGEAHKVLLAQALMQSPKLLILDEPFCGLDIATRETLASCINQIIQTGELHIMLLTSGMEEVPEAMTHILSLDQHRIISQGPKHQIGCPEFNGVAPFENPIPVASLIIEQPEAVELMADNSILIELQNVNVVYDGINILSGIDWQVKQGERWAILGDNGAGKSTLLSLICGDNPQVYANDIHVLGKQFGTGAAILEMKQRIGYVSPEFQIYYPGSWRCREVICSGFFDSIGLYQDCTLAQTAQSEMWLNYLELTTLAEEPFDTFSTGEQRLILLARALIKNPSLLILDEPCQGLDSNYRRRILSLLSRLCRKTNLAIIYVTHHPDEIPQFFTHILKIEQGRIIQSGPIEVGGIRE